MKFRNLVETIKNPEIYKFFLVGIIGDSIVLAFTVLFIQYVGIFYVISTTIAFELSQVWGFFANDRWTFSKVKKTSKSYVRFIKYNLFSLISLGIIQLVMITLTTQADMHYSVSVSIGIIVAFFFNFSISKKISFK